MYFSLACLLAFFSLCSQGTGHLVLRNVPPSNEPFNRTLFRRVRTGNGGLPQSQTVQSLFTTNAENPSICTSDQLATANVWINEVLDLHEAAVQAWSQAGDGDRTSEMLMSIYMGIKWQGPGDPDYTSKDIYNDGLDRLQAVWQFLEGGGLPTPKTETPPALYCGDAFATYVPDDQPVRDNQGNNVVNLDGSLKTIKDIFEQFLTYTQSLPFWVQHLKYYIFDNTGPTTLCGKESVRAKTIGRKINNDINDQNIVLGTQDPGVVLCPSAFSLAGGNLHTAASLYDATTYSGYPTAGLGPGLDTYVSVSATLYHELFHLTDGDLTPTKDSYTYLTDILRASIETGRSSESTSLVPLNPESYVHFAVAAYIYQNPPTAPEGSPEKPAVVFGGGIARTPYGFLQPPNAPYIP